MIIQSCSLIILNHSKTYKIESKVFRSDTSPDNANERCDHYDLFPQPTLYLENVPHPRKTARICPPQQQRCICEKRLSTFRILLHDKPLHEHPVCQYFTLHRPPLARHILELL